MIASEAAPSHQPGNATLHDPSLGKNGKALRRIWSLDGVRSSSRRKLCPNAALFERPTRIVL